MTKQQEGFFKILEPPRIKKTTIIFTFRLLIKEVNVELEVTTINGKYFFNEEIGSNELEKLTPEEVRELEDTLKSNA